jgi:hypothetical protein
MNFVKMLVVSVLLVGCGGDQPDCTAGAWRCAGEVVEHCWDPTGGGHVAWVRDSDCSNVGGMQNYYHCYTCANGSVGCASAPEVLCR